jgi:hypothetical protein
MLHTIIVHNRLAKEQILKMGYTGPIDVIPFAFPSADAELNAKELEKLRQKHGITSDELVIGCFGFIGPTKRIAQVCRALSTLREHLKFRFLVVGEGEDVRPAIENAGLTEAAICTGFVEDAQFSEYLGLTDIVVNLPTPIGIEGESPQALTAFALYVKLGDKRSVREVAGRCGKNASLCARWSAKHHWQERLRAMGTEAALAENEHAAQADAEAKKETALLIERERLRFVRRQIAASERATEVAMQYSLSRSGSCFVLAASAAST